MNLGLVNGESSVVFNNRIMSSFYHTNAAEFKEKADWYGTRRMKYRETIIKLTVNTGTKENRIT